MSPDDGDKYFDLDQLSRYCSLSVSTLRRHLKDPARPIPHMHMQLGEKGRGRVLVSKRAFDAWIKQFQVQHRPDDPADVSWIQERPDKGRH